MTENLKDQKSPILRLVPGVVMALIAWFGFEFIVNHNSLWTQGNIVSKLPFVPVYGSAVLLLLALYIIDIKRFRTDISFFGRINLRLVVISTALVCVVYTGSWLNSVYGWGSIEKSMELIHSDFITYYPLQVIFIASTLTILVPITEELIFRHFLLGAFNFPRSLLIQLSLVVVISLAFSFRHAHYANITTFVELFLLGIIFGCARVLSGGIALPIALHIFTNILGLSLNELYFRFIL